MSSVMECLSEAMGPPLLDEQKGMHQLLTEITQQYPNKLAISSIHQAHDYLGIQSIPLDDETYQRKPYLRWTFRQLQQATQQLIRGLRSLGAREGTPIITFIQNGVEYFMLIWAAIQLGCPFVPLNPRNLLNIEEAKHMVKTGKSVATSFPGLIIAQDVQTALTIVDSDLAKDCRLIVCSDEGDSKVYIKFSELVQKEMEPSEDETIKDRRDKTAIVLFSSGTTSLPKGVIWNGFIFAHVFIFRKNAAPMHPNDSMCLVVPNNHGLHTIFGISTLGQGAAVVLPGSSFQPQVMLKTMQREKCTHTILVPAMLHALLAEKTACGGQLHGLESVALGGSVITPEHLACAQDELGSKEVENAFGTTEGAYLLGGSKKERNELIKGNSVMVGRPASGAVVRVCAPDQFHPVPRGTLGELHVSSLSLVDGYIGKKVPDFYTDETGRRWYKTGDQAVMELDGRIFVTGRYKENIIRGGENVSPAAIESAISRIPKFAGLNIQIVRASDSIAGEVPIAVCVNALDSALAQELQNVVLTTMGAAFVPEEFIDLSTLGLQDFPKTMAGKIQKIKLAEIVEEHRKNRQVNGHSGTDLVAPQQIKDSIKEIWRRTVGHEVNENASIADFSDSITLMRVRDRIYKELGYNIPLADMVTAGTLAGQISLIKTLLRQVEGQKVGRKRRKQQRETPITADNIIVFKHQINHGQFERAKHFVSQSLAAFGLDWDSDIEDISPVQDFVRIHTQQGTMDSWTWTFGILLKTTTYQEMREALSKLFSNNPILASFFVWDQKAFGTEDLALHVVPKISQKLLDMCIVNKGKVKTIADLKRMCQDNLDLKHAKLPGPLTYAAIVEVEETQSMAVLLVIHHSIVDASSGQLIFEDLDQALGGQELVPHIDYKIWADSYYALKSSLDAQTSVNWHVNQLSGISSHMKAIFPHPKSQSPRDNQAANKSGEDGVIHSFTVSNLPALRHQHPFLTAPAILKTAWALLNVQRTGYTHALFANIEAARTRFPFIPDVLDDLPSSRSSTVFEATDVSGPVFQIVTNLLEIRTDESALDLLYRVQEHQNQLTRHASAPLGDIIRTLDAEAQPDSTGALKPSEIVINTVRTQVFNYLSTMANADNSDPDSSAANPYANIQIAHGVVRPEINLVVNAGLGAGPGTDKAASVVHDRFFLHVRSHVLSDHEMKQVAEDTERLVCWLVDSANWGRPMHDLKLEK